jgi:RNA polymerase sigma-70 factor (ECF subfamily)
MTGMDLSPASEPERATLEAIVRRYEAYVRALAARLAPSLADADDIAQESFLVLLAKRRDYDLVADPKPLLAAIVRNLSRQAWDRAIRGSKIKRDELAAYLEGVAEEDAPLYEEVCKEALRRCLEKATDKERALLNLRYTVGCDSEDIAGRLSTSAEAVRMALVRIRQRLKGCIKGVLKESPA